MKEKIFYLNCIKLIVQLVKNIKFLDINIIYRYMIKV